MSYFHQEAGYCHHLSVIVCFHYECKFSERSSRIVQLFANWYLFRCTIN